MGEKSAALIGGLAGLVTALAVVGLQSWLTDDQKTKYEKRERLELLMENAIQAHSCIFNGINGGRDECANDKSTMRLATISYIYFPELKEESLKFAYSVENAKLQVVKCKAKYVGERESNADLDCIERVLAEHDFQERLDALSDAVNIFAETLW